MKVLVACTLDPSTLDTLSARWDVTTLEPLAQSTLQMSIAHYDVVVIRSGLSITAAMIANSSRLRAVIRAGSGLDNIELPPESVSPIQLYSVPGRNARSVAELGIAQCISLLRHLPLHRAQMKAGVRSKGYFPDHELYGQQVGVIGAGAIGRELIAILYHMGCSIMYTCLSGPKNDLETAGAEFASVDEICRNCKAIFVQVPHTDCTKHLLGAEALSQMVMHPVLINLGRWDALDMQAALEALRGGQIDGLAVDPINWDESLEDFGLLNCEFSPHIGGSTVEAQKRVGVEVLRLLEDVAKQIPMAARSEA